MNFYYTMMLSAFAMMLYLGFRATVDYLINRITERVREEFANAEDEDESEEPTVRVVYDHPEAQDIDDAFVDLEVDVGIFSSN